MEDSHIKTVLMLGRPGSGKGTQTALLAEKLGWKTLSSGNIFREMRASEGTLGQNVRETYDAGLIFPDWFPNYLLLNSFLNADPKQGLICEGFGRTVDQAKLFDEVLDWLKRNYIVFNLAVSEQEAMKRQLGRNNTDARTDSDTPEKIQVRFNEYSAKTEPVIAFFKEKGTLVEINGEQTPEEIAQEIHSKLQPYL
jgi:adenylate kinase